MKHYLRDEVVIHNKPDDIWVIINSYVYDLTPMIQDRLDSMNDSIRLLIAFAGKDLSVYFDENNQPNSTVPIHTTDVPVYFKPACEIAYSYFCKTPGLPWWFDFFYIIGLVTKLERKVTIYNTLTATTQTIKVCEEDTISEILEKYRNRYNFHAGSYYFRKYYNGKTYRLDSSKTLSENGMHHIQGPDSLWAYFMDDFTVT